MTNEEKAIVMAYTGVCMLSGTKFHIFHEYVEKLMGRPVYTHELGFLADEIKEKAKDDFIKLCENEQQDKKSGKWEPRSIDGPGRSLMVYKCSECKKFALYMTDYCPSCGAKMEWRRQNEDNTGRLFK